MQQSLAASAASRLRCRLTTGGCDGGECGGGDQECEQELTHGKTFRGCAIGLRYNRALSFPRVAHCYDSGMCSEHRESGS